MKGQLLIFICLMLASCRGTDRTIEETSSSYAKYFEILDNPVRVVVMSPYDAVADTLLIDRSLDNLICMSSSHVAALSAIGADSVISAVSGIRYISDPDLRKRWRGTMDNGTSSCNRTLYDIGYEADLDYERILEIKPDLLLAYTVSGTVPQYIVKLRSLGIPVLVLHDHLEEHPLARAEYIRLFGALTGRRDSADSLYEKVCSRYQELCVNHEESAGKLLLNIPYGDAWYIPGGESYMAQLVRDAGGEVLGAVPGASRSSVMTMEQAYILSQDADIWLNPGHCRTREEVSRIHQLFPKFGPLADGLPIYNNTLRTTPEGGNDFWESGAVRPDLILEDLRNIISGNQPDSLNYFIKVD